MKNLAILGGKAIGAGKYIRNGNGWPIYDEKELQAVQDVIKSGLWGTGGPKQIEFEETFAEYCGAKYGVMMTNGTHTLKLALEVLGIGPGDEVIVPGWTWQATASSVLDVNAVPILVDVDPKTFTIDPKKVEEAITPRTKAIIPVHLYGRVCDMDAIMALAEKYNLYVIEDCAHQHGSEWRGKKVGTIGNIGSFSQQATKILQTGEGGICLTNDEELYERLYSMKFCGRERVAGAGWPTMQSGNFRSNEFAATLGLCQLSRLTEQNLKRRENALYLEDMVQQEIPGFSYLFRDERVTFQTYYRLSFIYNKELWDGISRETVLNAIDAELEGSLKMPTSYEPLNQSPLYQPHSKRTHYLSEEYWKAIDPKRFELPVIERLWREEAVNIDHCALLAEKSDMDRIVDAMKKVYKNLDELKEYDATLNQK